MVCNAGGGALLLSRLLQSVMISEDRLPRSVRVLISIYHDLKEKRKRLAENSIL